MTYRINADLYRIASGFISSEETRHYLRGVLVQPAPTGVFLVATDGHRLMCINDQNATLSVPTPDAVILALSDNAMKACRTKARDFGPRIIEIDGGTARVIQTSKNSEGDLADFETIAISERCLIDGTFPDWRRVLPHQGGTTASQSIGSYAGHYLATFAKAGDELSSLNSTLDRRAGTPMQVLAHDNNSPAWIRWFGVDYAFGVLMPVRSFTDSAIAHPAWLTQKPVGEAQAA